MRPIDLVVQRLREHGCKPRRVGKGWQALCPAHEDKNPSLNASEDMKGNVGIKCFANCATERVIAVLGLDWSDLFADNDRRRSMNILDTYPYVDEQGTTLFEVVRLSPKDFRQRRPDGNGGWSWKLDGVRRVPYRLNQVIEAIKNGELVIVTEGEKDTHTLEALGYTATTCPGGAGKWRNEYNQHFDGASVAVLGDNDPAGVANRNAIWSSLRDSGYPQDVIGLQVPDGYKDISEYVAAVGEANAREQVLRFTQFSIVRLPEEEDEEDKQAAADRHHLTDVGNARRFVAIAQGRIKYVHAWQKWIYWERGVWVIDEGEVLTRELAKQVPSNMLKFAAGDALTKDEREDLVNWALASESSGRIAAMVRESRGTPGMLVKHEMLDADAYILNCLNGTIDLRTGTLRKHDPADLCTRQVPVAYNPQARSELWETCLDTWQPDEEMRAYLQLEAGAATTGRHTETLSVHWGPGANGKSRFWGAIGDTLGPTYSVVPHKSLLITQRSDQHDTIYANLFRKRLAVASETDAGAKLADEKIKNLTGGDRLSGRRMREDPWEFQPSHTLVLFSNHKPQVQGRDEGIWRRLRLIPWGVTIPPEERDEHLDEKLRHERQGILAWCVEGARRFLAGGFTPPEKVTAATDVYRSEENVADRFVNECLVITGQLSDRARSIDIRDAAEEWANSKGFDSPLLREIAPLLEAKGCTSKQQQQAGKRSTWWRGVHFDGEKL